MLSYLGISTDNSSEDDEDEDALAEFQEFCRKREAAKKVAEMAHGNGHEESSVSSVSDIDDDS